MMKNFRCQPKMGQQIYNFSKSFQGELNKKLEDYCSRQLGDREEGKKERKADYIICGTEWVT